MTEYLLINCLISIWALLTQHFLLKDASHQFTLLIFSLLCWLVPFGWLVYSTEATFVMQTQPMLAQITKPVQTLISQPKMGMPWSQVFYTLILIGLMAFLADYWRLHKQHKSFKLHGKATAKQNIFTIKSLNNACVTGFNPSIIWIDEDLYHSDLQTSIVTHEQQHIKHGDPYWLLLITCVQKLFWFNPLIQLLAKQSKMVMELKCDQACKQELPDNLYQNQMAEILLTMQQRKTPLNNFMAQSTKNHIYRIKQLSKETQMKKHHKWLLTLSFAFTALLATATLAHSPEATLHNKPIPEIQDNQVFLELKFIIGDQDEKQLAILIENGEEGSVRMNGISFVFLSEIVKNQIVTSISVSQISNTSNKHLADMAMITHNNEWAGAEISASDQNEKISIEMKAVTSRTD